MAYSWAALENRVQKTIAELLKNPSGYVTLHGWVRTSRFSKRVGFIHLYDGSTPKTVQVVIPEELLPSTKGLVGTGTSVRVVGTWVESVGPEQDQEVRAERIDILGTCDATEYPIQKKETSPEFLRTQAHLRMRTAEFQSLFRVRNALSTAIHQFFQDRGFMWVHTPIITSSDCEGAGEMFEVRLPPRKDEHGNPERPRAFFGKPAFLTVSGQIEVETFASAFSRVYTFGPTFRAENSNTPRHAAEFWMVEPEIAFATLDDVIALAEDFVRSVTLDTIQRCYHDINNERSGEIALSVSKPFARITYREAQEILVASGRSFEYPIGYGEHLQSEHERYLAEEHFKGPVFVTDYPKTQKAFYMRLNDDGETVACTDLLVPGIGEIIGGSQREERLDKLDEQMARVGLDPAIYWWYRDLRKYGTVPHGGFGLGLERLLMWITGITNIRDAIPFPRTPGNAEF